MTDASPAAPRTLNTHHIPAPPRSLTAWKTRAAALREQIRFSLGLWPEPARTPLHPRVTGRIEGDGFVVENVAIETIPGFYLGGNLYRPASGKGPFPAIVNPHGHWPNGRLEREADVAPAAEGAPPADGRTDLVALAANLARQGFVVFAYDMVGYNDSDQLGPHDRFAGNLQAWLWNVSFAGLQTWNSIRVTDYLASLPYVDRNRIGATGASGGGTQTFLLTALDDRIKASVPVNMVSAYMQGGCKCENAPGLRVGTDNVEIAALMAPKPMLLIAATGDWTVHVPTEEYPAIRAVYDLYGAGDRTAVRQFNYGHNYNVESREVMYAWFAHWLKGAPAGERVRETPVTLDPARLRVWTREHPRPAGALTDAQTLRALEAIPEAHLRAIAPRDAAGLARFRAEVAPALANALHFAPMQPAPDRPATADPIVLLVAEAGPSERTDRLVGALTVLGCPLKELRLPPLTSTARSLWDGFHSTYNRTPLGDRVQMIADAIASLKWTTGARVSVAGIGSAGPAAILAAALQPGAVRVTAEINMLNEPSDDAFIPGLYAPGLRRAGDLRSAAILTAPAALYLTSTGRLFETEPIAAALRAAGAPEPRFDRGDVPTERLAAWLAGR